MSTRAGRSPIGEDAAGGDEAPPVKARGLVKLYKEVLAVDHIDLNVNAGDVYGFLGPNGAGKTTTLRMALGLIMPTAGTVELFGRDPIREGARALEGVAGFVEARARTSSCSAPSTAAARGSASPRCWRSSS
jgi:ABC-type Mn2+/Zn2+ transport system ATPase subunit